MKKLAVIAMLAVVAAVTVVTLAGCPALGLAEPGKVVLTVHNQTSAIESLRITELSDMCDSSSPIGANRLSAPLGTDKSISFSLAPGTYYMRAEYSNGGLIGYAHQTIKENFDWYVND